MGHLDKDIINIICYILFLSCMYFFLVQYHYFKVKHIIFKNNFSCVFGAEIKVVFLVRIWLKAQTRN